MTKKQRFLFLRLRRNMTAAPAETVYVPPAMNRNSVTVAGPVKISPGKKNPALLMREPTATEHTHTKRVRTSSGMMSRTLFAFAAVLLKIPFPGNPSCPAGYDYACFGRVTVISVPESTSLDSSSVPPRKATPCFTIESPRPVPPIFLGIDFYPPGRTSQTPGFCPLSGLDSIILHRNLNGIANIFQMNGHCAIVLIVLDSIIAEIIKNLLKNRIAQCGRSVFLRQCKDARSFFCAISFRFPHTFRQRNRYLAFSHS